MYMNYTHNYTHTCTYVHVKVYTCTCIHVQFMYSVFSGLTCKNPNKKRTNVTLNVNRQQMTPMEDTRTISLF